MRENYSKENKGSILELSTSDLFAELRLRSNSVTAYSSLAIKRGHYTFFFWMLNFKSHAFSVADRGSIVLMWIPGYAYTVWTPAYFWLLFQDNLVTVSILFGTQSNCYLVSIFPGTQLNRIILLHKAAIEQFFQQHTRK